MKVRIGKMHAHSLDELWRETRTNQPKRQVYQIGPAKCFHRCFKWSGIGTQFVMLLDDLVNLGPKRLKTVLLQVVIRQL
jgi:hypothetical protein